MSKGFDFNWHVGLAVALDLPQEELARCVNELNVALVNAITEVVMTFRHSGSEVHLAAGDQEKFQKLVTFRNAFEIAQVQVLEGTPAFDSPTAAVDELIQARANTSPDEADQLGVTRHPDGSYRLAQRQWSSCELDTEVEAQDALQAFEDASGYEVLPFVDMTTFTYDQDL